MLPELTDITKESDAGRDIADRRTALFLDRYMPQLKPFPQAKALLLRMRDHGWQLVVATSAHEQELERLLKLIDIEELLRDTTSSSEAEHSKPDEDIIEAALSKSGADPASSIMLGDTPYDIEAAARAQVPSVALRCGAMAIYDSPAALLTEFAQSPFSRRD